MENKETLVRYILGELPEEERENLEARYFVSDEAWAELQAAETDLIDSYLRNELSQQQRERFEKYFLASPRRQHRLEFARLQISAASQSGQEPAASAPAKPVVARPRFMLQFGFATAIVALMIAVVIITIQNLRLRDQLSAMSSQQTTLQQQLAELRQQLANLKESHDWGQGSVELLSQDQPTISLLLVPGALRGSGSASPVLPVSSVPSNVLLLLELKEDSFASYDVALRTVEGKQIQRLDGLKSTQVSGIGPAVAVKLSSKQFRRGDYIATLSGRNKQGKAEVIDSFTFTVVR